MFLNWKKVMPVVLAFVMVAGLAACAQNSPSVSVSAPTPAPASETPPAAPAPVDPTAKYDPPITVSTINIVDDTIKYIEGESHENNAYTRAYEEELGILLDYKWTVPKLQASEKINVLIATNDLPDIMNVDMKQLQRLVDSQVQNIVELGGLYDTYATDLTKGIRPIDDVVYKSATFNGKLMAMPYNATTGLDRTAVMWMRKDWLDKLGLEAPKTIDELDAVANAFVTRDPDGNGENDTYGIAVTQNIVDTFGGADGIFFAYNAYPGSWLKGADGSIVYGSVQPEMKDALLKLQDFYKKGYIDPEFGTKDGGKVAEYTSAGRLGIEMGMMWNAAWPLNSSRDNDENSEWVAYPLASNGSEPTKMVVTVPVENYIVVSKNCKNPEAVIKMQNMFYEKVYGPEAEPLSYWEDSDGTQLFKYAVIMNEKLYQNLDMHKNIVNALDTGDTSKLSAMQTVNYEKTTNVENGSRKSADWSMAAIYGRESSFAVLKGYEENKLYFYDEFYGAPTETMATKGSNLVKNAGLLSKSENEVFTKIIMGDSIDTFDAFVEDWKRLGGDQITQEVNDWYAANNG